MYYLNQIYVSYDPSVLSLRTVSPRKKERQVPIRFDRWRLQREPVAPQGTPAQQASSDVLPYLGEVSIEIKVAVFSPDLR